MPNNPYHYPGNPGHPQVVKNVPIRRKPRKLTKSQWHLSIKTNTAFLINRCHRCFKQHDICKWRNLCGRKPCEECTNARITLEGFCCICQCSTQDLSFRLYPHCTAHCPSNSCTFCKKLEHYEKICPDVRVHRFLNRLRKFRKRSKNGVSACKPSAEKSAWERGIRPQQISVSFIGISRTDGKPE